jgi:hypothetical protein
MGKLHTIGKATIRVYANDHMPPHFHVVSADAEALIEIATLTILRGSLPARLRVAALAWATSNRSVIAAEWNRINPRFAIA